MTNSRTETTQQNRTTLTTGKGTLGMVAFIDEDRF